MSAEDFDNSETEILTALNVTGGVLSLCGSIFIILTYYKYRELQKLSFKLIVFISIADFTTSLAKCFGSPATGTFGCGLQGFLTTFGDLASYVGTPFVLIINVTTQACVNPQCLQNTNTFLLNIFLFILQHETNKQTHAKKKFLQHFILKIIRTFLLLFYYFFCIFIFIFKFYYNIVVLC